MRSSTSPKCRRCFHRAISGLEAGGHVRFITLTTNPKHPDNIHRHFRTLVKRLQRRGLLKGYLQVQELTKSGLPHKHILFKGKYIDQLWLSQQWDDIHGAPMIDVRALHKLKGKKAIAAYIAKYMAKGPQARYSWSWEWVWRGFVRDWAYLKVVRNRLIYLGIKVSWGYFLYHWRKRLKSKSPPGKGFELTPALEPIPVLLAILGIQKKGDDYVASM